MGVSSLNVQVVGRYCTQLHVQSLKTPEHKTGIQEMAVHAGYHQESGRAGRDGKPADVVLYFARGDVAKARSMLETSSDEAGKAGKAQLAKATAQLRHNMQSLNAVAAYAENRSKCRRVMLMKHFGEDFRVESCAGEQSIKLFAATSHFCVFGSEHF